MKKENPMLKKALEEAARQEMASLPEERQIIRPYSDKFEKEMSTLLSSGTPAVTRKRPRVKVAALIAAMLVICLSLSAGATNVLKIFSPEWRESIREAVNNATYSDEVAEKIDSEISNMIRTAYQRAETILTEHIEKLHKVAELLLEKEKIDGEEFNSVFDM